MPDFNSNSFPSPQDNPVTSGVNQAAGVVVDGATEAANTAADALAQAAGGANQAADEASKTAGKLAETAKTAGKELAQEAKSGAQSFAGGIFGTGGNGSGSNSDPFAEIKARLTRIESQLSDKLDASKLSTTEPVSSLNAALPDLQEAKNLVVDLANQLPGRIATTAKSLAQAVEDPLEKIQSRLAPPETSLAAAIEKPLSGIKDEFQKIANAPEKVTQALEKGLRMHLEAGGTEKPFLIGPIAATVGGGEKALELSPLTANVGGTDKPILLAPIAANIGGGTNPVQLAPITANVGGTDKPVVLAPVKMELAVGTTSVKGSVTMAFRIFGLKIFSFSIGGDAQIN